MNADEPQDEQAWLTRYRRASEAEGATPGEATRDAILAEGRRVATEQARPEALKPFDTRQGAANQRRFRMASFGTLGAALLAGVFAIPLYQRSQRPAVARTEPADSAVTVTAQRPSLPEAPAADAAAPAPMLEQATPLSTAAARALAAPQRRVDGPALDEAREAEGLRETSSTQKALKKNLLATPRMKSAPLGAVPAPLLKAVTDGDLSQATRLLDQGASPRETDEAGRSALFLAVMQRRGDLVRLLLDHGADASAADREGQTPLGWARQQQDAELVRVLSAPRPTH